MDKVGGSRGAAATADFPLGVCPMGRGPRLGFPLVSPFVFLPNFVFNLVPMSSAERQAIAWKQQVHLKCFEILRMMERNAEDKGAPATGRQLLRQNSKEYDAQQKEKSVPYTKELVKLVQTRLADEQGFKLLQLRVQFLLEDTGSTTRIVHVEVIVAAKVRIKSASLVKSRRLRPRESSILPLTLLALPCFLVSVFSPY